MKYPGQSVLVLLIAMVLCPAIGLAGDSPAKRLIERGDRFFANREKGRKWVERATGSYEKALAVDPKSVEASWKYARASFWIGSHSEDEDEKLRFLSQAIDVTKRAIKLDPKSVESHYWLGVGFAKYGEAKGVMNALGLIEPIRKQMRKVIELDEKFAGGGAYRILGWISYKLPGVAGGSDEQAVELLNKAVELGPGHLLNHLCLAEIHRVNDRSELARKHLEIIAETPPRKESRPEDLEIKEAAKEMMEELPR